MAFDPWVALQRIAPSHDRAKTANRAKPSCLPDHAGLPDEWRSGIERLRTQSCPPGIPPDAWARTVADTLDFIALWATTANRLGWSTLQLFGVDPHKPMARTDCMGLCRLLDGRTVAALTAEKIAIKDRNGRVKHFYRQPEVLTAVPMWELLKLAGARSS